MSDDPQALELPDGFHDEFEAAPSGHARWKVVGRYFRVAQVNSNRDIRPDTLYFVHAKQSHVIRSGGEEINVDPVPMTVLPSGRAMKPVPRKILFEMGRNSQFFRLERRKQMLGDPSVIIQKAGEHNGMSGADGESNQSPNPYRDTMLDIGSFTQLFTIAQQSGIVPSADQIAHVRDCEFRMGQHQIGFEIIERVYVSFQQAADVRMQRLRREEIDYKSGVLKMTLKEWQKKKHRDTVQTNNIERARRHFVRVLDGLRVLMIAEQQDGKSP